MGQINKKNLFWNSLSFILISILGFINFTLNLKTYDSNIFGYFLLLSAYWGIGGSIDFGFGVSSIKNISESIKENDYSRINKIVNSYFATYLLFAAIIIVVIYSIMYIFKSLAIAETDNYNINILMILFAIAFLFKYLSGFILTVYEGLSKFILLSKINLFFAIFNTIQTILIFIFSLSLYYLIFSQIIYSFFLFASLLILLMRKSSFIKFGVKFFDFKTLKKDGVYNFNLQMSFILNTLIDPTIKTIISHFLGLQYITYFEAAKRIINLSNGLINSALKGLLNKISEANVEKKLTSFLNDDVYKYSLLALDYSILSYGILNPLICFFILLWFNSYETMIIFILFLLPYSIINLGGPLYSILMIEGRGSKLTILQLINLVTLSGFFYLTVSIFDSYAGLIGFYIATILNSYLMVLFLQKYLGFNFKLFLKNVKSANLLKLNIILIIELLACMLYPEYTYYQLGIFLIIFTATFKNQIFIYWKYFVKRINIQLLKRTNIRK